MYPTQTGVYSRLYKKAQKKGKTPMETTRSNLKKMFSKKLLSVLMLRYYPFNHCSRFRKYRWVCVRQCQSQGAKSFQLFLYFRIDRSLINLLSCILIKLIYENKFSFWLNPFLDGFGQLKIGGDETRSGYMWYIQGIQPNVPARTTCRQGL